MNCISDLYPHAYLRKKQGPAGPAGQRCVHERPKRMGTYFTIIIDDLMPLSVRQFVNEKKLSR